MLVSIGTLLCPNCGNWFNAYGSGAGVSLTAPVLYFASPTDPDSDTTQGFEYDLVSPVAGDNIYTCAKIGGFSISNDPTEYDVRDIHTLTQPEIDALVFPVVLALVPDGSWSVRAFHERSGTFSSASNVVTKTITTTPASVSTYYWLGF